MERPTKDKEQEEQNASVVLFDVDNTLIKGFSIMLFAEHLKDNGAIPNSVLEQMNKDMDMPRSTEKEYEIFAETIVAHFYQGLKDHPQEEIEVLGQSFLYKYTTALKPYAVDLVRIMANQGQMIAVSGAPKEAFLPLAGKLGIQPEYLLEGEVTNGVYTGEVKVNMALGHKKKKAVSNPFFILGEDDPEQKKTIAIVKGYIPVTANDIIQKVRLRIAELESKSK